MATSQVKLPIHIAIVAAKQHFTTGVSSALINDGERSIAMVALIAVEGHGMLDFTNQLLLLCIHFI